MSPMRPKKPCRYPQCTALTHERFCDEHHNCHLNHVISRKQTNPDLARADKFYTDHRWRKLRAIQLRSCPFCQSCSTSNNPVLACDVDHIKPIALGGAKLSLANLQSLCRSCHNKKRQSESVASRLR